MPISDTRRPGMATSSGWWIRNAPGVSLSNRDAGIGRSRPVREQAPRVRVVGRRPVVAGGIALDPRVGPVELRRHDGPAVVPARREGQPAVGRGDRRERGFVPDGDRLGHGAVPAVDAGAVDARVAVPLRIEDDLPPVRRPRRRAVPVLVVRQPAHGAPVRLHHVQLAGQVGRRGTGPGARRHRRVAAAGEENPRAVGREGRVVVSRGLPRQVHRLLGRGRVPGSKTGREDVRVAVPRADEEQPPAVRRDGRRILQRGTLDQRPRLRVALQVEHVQIRIAAPLGREHHPAPVGRDDAVVVESRIRRQPPGLGAGTVEEVQIPVGRLDAAVDDGLLVRPRPGDGFGGARRDDEGEKSEQPGTRAHLPEDRHRTSPPRLYPTRLSGRVRSRHASTGAPSGRA